MERVLCVWFPDWPLRSRREARPDRPRLVVGEDQRVAAADPEARAAGVEVGMPRRQAEVLCPEARTLRRDREAEAVAFEAVAAAVETLVPRVEVADPGLLYVPLRGAVRYYGGEQALAARVSEAVEEVAGPGGKVGVAAGPFAARWAARRAGEEPLVVEDDAPFLRSLEVEALGGDELAATLRWLGITTLGELAGLPRSAMASRFGEAGLEAHRLACGEDRSVAPRLPPVDPAVEERFEEPLTDLEQAAFAARRLAHRLLSGLSAQGVAPHLVEIEAQAARGERGRVWRSAEPFDEAGLAERVRWQLQAWMESGGIPGGLVRLRLVPGDLSGRGRQGILGRDQVGEEEARRALARAQALLGPEGVLEARPQGGREPSERVRWHRWGEPAPPPERDPGAPWPGRIPGPAPSLVPPDPPRLEVEWEDGLPTRLRLGSRWVEVLSWSGPWRRLGRWWEGEDPADRYQLVTSAGAFLCEVRGGRVYLTGIYD